MRSVFAYVMALVLALSGVVLAEAKGKGPVTGTDIVICSGVGVTVITIGPDGEPVERVDVCPEGHSIFAAAFALPEMPRPALRLIAVEPAVEAVTPVARDELTPSARGPPVSV